MPKKAQPTETKVRQAAQKNEKAFKDAFLTAIDDLSNSVSMADLSDAISRSDPAAIESVTNVDSLKDELNGPITVGILAALLSGGTLARDTLPSSISAGAPDMLRDSVQQWAREHSGALITNITETSRDAIRFAISDALSSDASVRRIANRIQNLIGLTAPQSKVLENSRQAMEAAGIKKSSIDKTIKRRARQMKVYRARVIARTEAFTATSMGQQLYWSQLVEDGTIEPSAKRKWSTSEDERVCPVCRPMDGQIRGLTEPFVTGGGDLILTSPAHPVCRCSVSLLP